MKVISSSDAAALIADGWTVSTSGFTGSGHPEGITAALEQRFLRSGAPRNLTLIYAAGQGDRETRGTGRFGHEGLVKRIIGGHWGAAPRLGALAVANKVEAYNWPQGVIAQLYRAIAGNKPGVITSIGLHTFIDPRRDGGRLNAVTTEELVELVVLRGEEFLFYPAQPIHCAILRATSADAAGNLSMEEEPHFNDVLPLAQAAHNSGGIVIAQVKQLKPAGAIHPMQVKVPGIIVDYVVVAEKSEDHWQTYGEEFNPAYCGDTRQPSKHHKAMPLDLRKIVQRRALFELLAWQHPTGRRPIVNLGVGMSAGVGEVAREEGLAEFVMTVESGPIGGVPAQFPSFGASAHPDAIVSQAEQFDFYDGGGLDLTFLGLAQMDLAGNVNVSRFGERIAGVGGFVNITQTTREIVFMGSLTAKGLEVRAADGKLEIVREGTVKKVVAEVEHLSFNGSYTAARGIKVLYLTERAVFELREGRLTLTEIAPGVDLARQVMAQLAAPVPVAPDLKTMDARIFTDAPMFAARK
ncbi:MAG: acyl CoA:acetate/3-ketoacid CoA transferase [Candidatus Parcubacteria bacterium]|nr:acyl CoA:acetate/3-ketoacid CoA transferase [Burkholderiales bacterium]